MSVVAPVLSRPLAGRHVVVTRPAEQAQHLAGLIKDAGGVALLFPVLTIADIEDKAPLASAAARLEEFDLAVFVSPNAVLRALPTLLASRAWPKSTRVATVGKGSERTLERFGIADVIAPRSRFDSEALLELPEMQQMAGRRVLIFRGDGGRELLGETLTARGASVEYLSCYRRGKPDASAAPLAALWSRGELDALIVTSSEGLRNLCEMLDDSGRASLASTLLFAPHQRIAEEARRLGLARVVLAEPGDDGLIAALIAHFSADRHGN